MMVVHVEFVASLDQHNIGAEPLGLADLGPGANSILLCFITGRDTAGCIGHDGYHGQGTVAQLRPQFLFHGREIGIEIEEEPLQAGIPRSERTVSRVGHVSQLLPISDFLLRC
jgi:hypothetical protein